MLREDNESGVKVVVANSSRNGQYPYLLYTENRNKNGDIKYITNRITGINNFALACTVYATIPAKPTASPCKSNFMKTKSMNDSCAMNHGSFRSGLHAWFGKTMLLTAILLSGLIGSAGAHFVRSFPMPEILPAAGSLSKGLPAVSFSEQQGNPFQIRELDLSIALMTVSTDRQTSEEGSRLHCLVTELLPAVQMRKGKVVHSDGKMARVIDTDAASLSSMVQELETLDQVEMITVRVNTPADILTLPDLDRFTGLQGLKYLYILFTYRPCTDAGCEQAIIQRMIQGKNTRNIRVFFKISIAN